MTPTNDNRSDVPRLIPRAPPPRWKVWRFNAAPPERPAPISRNGCE
jgi:hypothetical protein